MPDSSQGGGGGGGKGITSLLSLSFPFCWHSVRQSPHFQVSFRKCFREDYREEGSGHLQGTSGTHLLTWQLSL